MSSPRSKPLILRIVSRMAIGGVQRGLLNTLKRADRERFEYALLCTKKAGVWAEQVRALGIPLTVQKTLPGWDPYQIVRLARAIRKIGPDLVHVHMAPTVIPAATAARLAGVRRIVIQHHNLYDKHWDEQNALLRAWEFHMTRGAGAIIAVSEPVAECTRRRLGLARERVTTIINGIDLEHFQNATPHDPRPEWGIAPDRPLVLLVSRYLETKRVEDFIAAAALVMRDWNAGASGMPPPFFAIVGDGPEYLRQRYAAKIAECFPAGGEGSSDAIIRLVGSRHDLPSILPHAAVGVVTSELEGCPNTILEYLATGVPIAATNIAPIAAIVQNEKHALLGNVGDAPALANSITRLLNDAMLTERLTTAGRKIIQAYDWQVTIHGYERVYRRMLGIS